MDELTTQLLEELDAFRTDWRTSYPTLFAAVCAAGLTTLFKQWQATPAGQRYVDKFSDVPDHVGTAKREVEAYRCPRSLPFGYDNLGQIVPEGTRDNF